MTEERRQRRKDLLRSLAISFSIAIIFYLGAPPNIAPKHPLFVIVSGLAFGFGFFFAGALVERTRFRSFVITSLARSAIVFLTMGACLLVVMWTAASLAAGVSPFHPKLLQAIWDAFTSRIILIFCIAGYLFATAINAFQQINRKLGPGVLWNWITGKYHQPRETERIFMFLDLKDSTTLAERLGALRFSSLVRDFFHDLTLPVLQSKGEVSHYIGDEAVLTWKPAVGLEKANCLECFFLMAAAIEKRSSRYLKEYGIVPQFKAGVHIGPVVATEVGEIKSEIVYHGDVLNTTARLAGYCSQAGADLLISGELLARLELPGSMHAESRGRHLFKGKEHDVEVFAVSSGVPIPSARSELPDSSPVAAEEFDRR